MHAPSRPFAPLATALATAGAALALSGLAAAPARAQAMVESGSLTSESATTATEATRPAWARDNESSASRFLGGSRLGLRDGSWFVRMGVPPHALTNISTPTASPFGGGGARPAAGRAAPAPPEPVLPRRPRSNAPGRVAGLVYELGTKRPIAGALVRLVSADPGYAVERLDARTDSAGYYEFPRVEPGPWRLGIVQDALSTRWVPPRVARAFTLARRDTLVAPPFALRRAACVHGHAGWSDGYVLFDAPLTVAPLDTTLNSTGTLMDGVGDFRLCGAPEDSVMIWMHLRDGRSLGHAVRLSGASDANLAFQAEPEDRMQGCTLRVLPVLNDGTPVPHAAITVVGRRFEQGKRPALVYVRDEQADADGVAEFRVPFGVYELLVVNPRQGQTGRVRRMVVDTDQAQPQPLRVELRDPVSPGERARLRADLLDRAETYLYVWSQ